MQQTLAIHWFRRDLRLHDNAALYHALRSGSEVQCIFIFDTDILDRLELRNDARVHFIWETLRELKSQLRERGSDLLVFHGRPVEIWRRIKAEMPVSAVYANRDYEPDTIRRDREIAGLLAEQGIKLQLYKDHVIFEEDEVLSASGTPYTVYTPYARKWLETLGPFHLEPYPVHRYLHALHPAGETAAFPSLEELGFRAWKGQFPPVWPPVNSIRTYDRTRDFPARKNGTSHMGLHLRFGTQSIRRLAAAAREWNPVYLKELLWREFFIQVLYHYPEVVRHAFRKEYDNIAWRNDEGDFEKWCRGETGFPLVDAGMRELNRTGHMHNRVRMVVASFLVKDLLIDWRWGEGYFASRLLDYELASNNGNWQWVAGTGCDAAPYFRVFNPDEQQKRFDPQGQYIRRWIPGYDPLSYIPPMLSHGMARERALRVYKAARSGAAES